MKLSRALLVVWLASACSPVRGSAPPETRPATTAAMALPHAPSLPLPPPSTIPSSVASAELRRAEAQLEPDGNDEVDEPELALPERAHFEKMGRHWAALQRICDFAVLNGALYLAHATQPLGLDGASITRYDPREKQPFALAFDWNRPHEPTKGGGAGQGFLRIRAIDGRLYVPDADPPYLGLGIATGIEGYLFVSDARGAFASARLPGHLPPRAATAERAGSVILPGAIHDFDVIRFRGKLYASTSAAIPPNGTAKTSPGTLLTPGDALGKWQVAFTYAGAPGEESVRLGYMTRFRDRLYVAISPLYGLDQHDFLIIAPPRERATFSAEDARAVRASRSGRAHTLRWYADRGKLYWITLEPGGVFLYASEDGERFDVLAVPPDAGNPSDLLRVGSRLLMLAEHGLYELTDGGFRIRAPIVERDTPFKLDDAYCAPPLVAFDGALYAGDQRRGALWKLVAD